jgi:phenylpyruvate tautomerase PptA (4-oxalocrotonate tautomerase family)
MNAAEISRRKCMPIAYLDVPEGIEIEEKKKLVKDIYEAFDEAYPFPPDHRIFVHEWPLDSISQNGQLGSEPPRPVLQIHAPEGLPVAAKRKMINSINAAVAKAYNNPPGFLILLQEYPPNGVTINVNLNYDNQEHLEELSRSIRG